MSNGHRKLPVFTTVGAVLRRLAEDLLDYALLALPMFLYWTFATYLQVSVSWAQKRAADGTLPTLRIGRSVRFDPNEIRAYARGANSSRTVLK